MIDTRILVLFELRQLVLADVDHDCRPLERRGDTLRLLLLWVCCVWKKNTRENREAGAGLACDCGNDVGHRRGARFAEPWNTSIG